MRLLYDFKKQGTRTNLKLSHIGGFLMLSERQNLDSFFQWQRNSLVYSSFLRHYPIIFTKSTIHSNKYLSTHKDVNSKIKKISKFIDIKLPSVKTPITIKCKIENNEIQKVIFDKEQKHLFDNNTIYTNQVSPMAEIIFDKILEANKNTIINRYQYKFASKLAVEFNNKVNYVNLIQNSHKYDLPYHTPTIIVSFEKLQKLDWTKLKNLFETKTSVLANTFYVKLAINSGGEINVMMNEENFKRKLNILIDGTLKANIQDANFLIQKKVNFNKNEELTHLGFIYYIKNPKNIKRIDIHAQIYSDVNQTTFLGSYISKKLENKVLSLIDEEKIINLCKIFAKAGYEGPINFDAIINDKEQLEFIYDCNPRMTGTLPSIAIYDYFKKKHDINIDVIVPIGYRGNLYYPDIDAKLEELDSKNLLFTKKNNKGVLLIPSFVRSDSYDMWFINMGKTEIKAFAKEGLVESFSIKEKNFHTGIYF
ncbi:MAG: Unknown protein [uncultured Campylobacterales bacterium]|uniref:ATP-grasp domain-containing protein n=1 Tax=uncultured Campylobacterales bacterium TaxID=352960 RepID=A0A6S6RZM1_9BACT|nr:MAG: Unknown protein [uncultured Campylobacterales bacterium]